ncbi:MAG: hypothetical protein WC492_04970 [Candidatus Micrarchaeia archaeon]
MNAVNLKENIKAAEQAKGCLRNFGKMLIEKGEKYTGIGIENNRRYLVYAGKTIIGAANNGVVDKKQDPKKLLNELTAIKGEPNIFVLSKELLKIVELQ